MEAVLGLVVLAVVAWFWWQGSAFARWLLFVVLFVMGAMLAAAGIKPGESIGLRYAVIAAVLLVVVHAPLWVPLVWAKFVPVGVQCSPHFVLQLVGPHRSRERAEDHGSDAGRRP